MTINNRSHMTAKERKAHPIFSGVLKYFPDALMEVAEVSRIGNDQHNPGQPLHWNKGVSEDHGDALTRHQLDAGTRDTDGARHSAKVAWRALAQLQREIEAEEELFHGTALGSVGNSPVAKAINDHYDKQLEVSTQGLEGAIARQIEGHRVNDGEGYLVAPSLRGGAAGRTSTKYPADEVWTAPEPDRNGKHF